MTMTDGVDRPAFDPALVDLRREGDGIGWIEMKDEVGDNAFSSPFVSALLGAIERASNDVGLKVVILAGTPRVFSSGATRDVLERLRARELAPTELVLGRRLMNIPVPVVAAAEGHAVGGGLALLLSADLSVVARESRYGANFVSLGLTPGMGTTCLLESVVSRPVAHELLYSGELRLGADFEGVSGFNAVAPRSEVRDVAYGIAWRIAEHRRETLVLLKRALTLSKRRALEEAMTLESLMHELTLPHLETESLPGGAR
jgi:4-carboxy-3-alkylbut-2-enoyl-[acp] decarboxylase